MSPENVHDRKEKSRFTFVVVPSGESKQTRTFSISKWGLVLSGIALFIVTVFTIFALIVYTPVRSLLPVSNPELEKRYGRQIFQIQEEVTHLVEEMNVLRSYNLRLRKALGESMTTQDSTLIASHDLRSETKEVQKREQKRDDPVADPRYQKDPQVFASYDPVMKRRELEAIARPSANIEFPLSKPADGYVTRGFDVLKYHYGIDFAGKRSATVVAAADGNVIFAGWTYEDGFMEIIAHEMGYVTVYKHNEALLKSTGASVKRGEPIALLGNTGRTSSGPHLHFEIWKDGFAYDPGQFLLTTQ